MILFPVTSFFKIDLAIRESLCSFKVFFPFHQPFASLQQNESLVCHRMNVSCFLLQSNLPVCPKASQKLNRGPTCPSVLWSLYINDWLPKILLQCYFYAQMLSCTQEARVESYWSEQSPHRRDHELNGPWAFFWFVVPTVLIQQHPPRPPRRTQRLMGPAWRSLLAERVAGVDTPVHACTPCRTRTRVV